MRIKSIAMVIISGAIFFALLALTLGQTPQVQVQTPQIQAQRITLSQEKVVSRMQADDTSAGAAALPLADLTIKGMCLEHDRKTGWNWLRVRLANTGAADAGAFELGLVFTSPGGDEKLMTDKVAGLKAGESNSQDYSPLCCGFVPTNSLVETSSAFRAIADPKYYKSNPSYPMGLEVKPVIHESNEKNNELTIAKSEIKPCSQTIQRVDRLAPQVPLIRKPQ